MNTLLFVLLLTLAPMSVLAQAPPNVIVIYADDLGYGDVSCYGASSLKAPKLDRLARERLRFTMHSPAATCTPSRYAMLTGEYAWPFIARWTGKVKRGVSDALLSDRFRGFIRRLDRPETHAG